MNAKYTLLAVDDESLNLLLLEKTLKNQYRVLTALSADEAWLLLDKNPVDLVLLDVSMPGTDGFTFCERVKKESRLKDIPIIFLTAFSDTENIVKGLEIGGNDHISKPFVSEILKSRIQIQLKIVEHIRNQEEVQRNFFQVARLASVGTLSAGIAHELNTPLAIITAYATKLHEQILENNFDKEESSNTIDTVLRMAERMRKIIAYVREFADYKKDQQDSATDLNEVIGSTLLLFKQQFADRQITETLQLTSGLPKIQINRGKFEFVIQNLLLNARDAFDQFEPATAKNITVTTARVTDSPNLVITVKDNGKGISKVYLDKLFDPFFTLKEVGQGTGLGLSIIYSIIKAYGGAISVKSEENGGTIVQASLPLQMP